ncbi:MAG: DUF2917 domain-containing protein [Janthinobacterium lividum]
MDDSSDQSSSQRGLQPGSQSSQAGGSKTAGSPVNMVIHLSVQRGETLPWRVEADADLCINHARVWVTRIFFHYDHWLEAGQSLPLNRGEKIWISTDSETPVNVTLTSAIRQPKGVFSAWQRLRHFFTDRALLRARQPVRAPDAWIDER